MKKEIDVALNLLVSYIERYGSLKKESIEQFRAQLEKTLHAHYQGHWYPDKPIKGQAYRSLEFNKENDYCDTIVARVCRNLGFTPDLLGIQHELTLWIDPYEVSIRLENYTLPKQNQQLLVAQFDKQGNELVHYNIDALFSQSRIPMINISQQSPTISSSNDSDACSDLPTSQSTSSSYSIAPPSMYYNVPRFPPPRALSPQAPVFQMPSSSPIHVPSKLHLLDNIPNDTDDNLSIEENNSQPERSDTPQSTHSTTSNESTDSGYCGYVESYPYYYKLNRLYKALAFQKLTENAHLMRKIPHRRTTPYYNYQEQQKHTIPSYFSTSPTTPTPMNIDQLTHCLEEQTLYPISTTTSSSRKFKC